MNWIQRLFHKHEWRRVRDTKDGNKNGHLICVKCKARRFMTLEEYHSGYYKS